MSPLEQDLEQYLMEVMGLKVTACPLPGRQQLPHFLVQLYEPRLLKVGARSYVGVFLKEGADLKPAAFEKHVRQLPWGEAEGFCLVAKTLPGYVRKRLIEKKISFVIPWSQLYFPELGMELRPRSGRPTLAPVEQLSPATQVVILYALNGHVAGPVPPNLLAQQLGYTAMTMTRALNELEAMKLGAQAREGKQRLVSFPEGRSTLWERARPLMRSPVQENVRLLADSVPNQLRLLAGESALAACSMLGAPGTPVYAVSREDWKAMEKGGVQRIPVDEPGTCVVQVWRYPPALMASQGHVDPFSLYLSLADEHDERVQAALDDMMERLKW